MWFLVVFPMTCCQMPSVKASPMDTLKKCCAAFHCRKMAKTDQLMPRMLMVAMGSLKFSNNPVMMSLMVRLVFMRVNLPQLQFCKHIDQMHVRIAFHGFVKLSFSFRWRLGAYDLTRHYSVLTNHIIPTHRSANSPTPSSWNCAMPSESHQTLAVCGLVTTCNSRVELAPQKKSIWYSFRLFGFEDRSSTQHNTFPVCWG